MLSKEDKRNFGLIVNWNYFRGATPFTWNAQLENISIQGPIWKKGRWLGSACGWTIYSLYLGARCIQGLYYHRPLEYIVCFFIFIASLIPIAVNLMIILKHEDIILCVNSIISFSNSISAKYASKSRTGVPINKTSTEIWMRRVVSSLFFICRFYPIFTTLFYLSQPYAIYFITAIVPPLFRNSIMIILYSAMAYWIISCAFGSVTFFVNIAVILVVAYFQLISQLNLKTKHYWTKCSLRTVHNLTIICKTLLISLTLFENYLRDIVMPVQMILTRTVVVCNFILIRHGHKMRTFDMGMFTVVPTAIILPFLVLLHIAADIHFNWVKCIKSWGQLEVKNQHELKAWNKTRRSFRPMCVRVGHFYTVRHKNVFEVGLDIVKITVRVLLMF